MAGIRLRELCRAHIRASIILSLVGVVGESLSFSILQMQRRLRPDSNGRLEATYHHSLIRRCAQNDHGHRGRLVKDSCGCHQAVVRLRSQFQSHCNGTEILILTVFSMAYRYWKCISQNYNLILILLTGSSITVPIDRILSVKNARAWVSMDFT